MVSLHGYLLSEIRLWFRFIWEVYIVKRKHRPVQSIVNNNFLTSWIRFFRSLTDELSNGRTFTYGATLSFSRSTKWTFTVVPMETKECDHYWMRLSKISWFVSSEQISYLPKPKQIIDLRDTDKSRYFVITEFNNCFIIRSPIFFHIYM